MQLVKQDRVNDALPHLAAASASRPDWVDARFNYGVALAKTARFAEAVREFEAVLRLKPGHEQAAQMLAKAKAAAGRP
jgi:predicted Zn-dependent protease